MFYFFARIAMKRLTALLVAGVMTFGVLAPVSAAEVSYEAGGDMAAVPTQLASTASIFTDVTRDNINAEAITYLKVSGIVEGYADGRFGVDSNINRAEFVKILLMSTGATAKDGDTCLELSASELEKYPDVLMDSWYAPYMCLAVTRGLMEGYPDGRMRPDLPINVPEMAKIVSLAMELPLPAEGAEWYTQYMSALETRAALPSTLASLSEYISRGEMAEVVFRLKNSREDKAAVSTAELLGQPRARLASGTVGTFGSCSELSRVMEEQIAQEGSMLRYATGMPAPESMDAANMPTTGGGVDKEYSTTNIQVEGVDEGDLVKNDGRYIYIVQNDEVVIVDTQDSTEGLKEIARIKTVDQDFYPTELYVDGDHLVIVGSTREQVMYTVPMDTQRMSSIPGPGFGRSMTTTVMVNIANKTAPQIERTIALEGGLAHSRRIGDKLYLVLNQYPNYWLMRQNFAPVEDILPVVSDSARDNAEKRPVANCDEVQYFPGYTRPNYMTVAVLPTQDMAQDVEAKVYLGDAETIYMSPEALYVTTGVRSEKELTWSWNDTQLYKFALKGTGVEQVASGRVAGRVLNQFSMDEHNGNFRIATQKDNWEEGTNNSENAVYVLDGDLQQIGAVTNIAPGERIYSARFMGDRGYLVTFKNVDPFFVLDLTTPTAPKILGELKIPGWSNYLHPYDENHVIGIGQDVEVTTESDDITWENIQGMKISMFDVTDVANPKEKFTTVLGARGTYSEILYNHKALLFDKEKNLLAFPVTITEPDGVKIYKECSLDAAGQEVCEETGRYDDFKTVFDGAVVMNIDLENGFTERGRLSHFAGGFLDYSEEYSEAEYMKSISRILYIGDKLYTVSQAMVKAATLDTVQETDSVELKVQ